MCRLFRPCGKTLCFPLCPVFRIAQCGGNFNNPGRDCAAQKKIDRPSGLCYTTFIISKGGIANVEKQLWYGQYFFQHIPLVVAWFTRLNFAAGWVLVSPWCSEFK